ncbi:MAG: choice-of-anchor D domain-containing protein, partial [Saprospiraceae bacterium]|nr:choice-of-anchor D domain-containing protein [Saprospiraceae bacterium]
ETFSIDNVSVPLAQGLACPQEINLKQSATNIPSGGSYNYGSVQLGSNNSKVFTIENTGSFTLTLTGTPPNYVVKGGSNPGDFTITQPATGTITGDNSTTFTVVFTPGGLGARSCTLSIGNSDSNENPYTLTLNGTGTCPAITYIAVPIATCVSTTNGQIIVGSVTGGVAPYQYSKDNGANYQPGATLTGLAPGTYQVVVKDANGCTTGATPVPVGSLPAPNCLITGPPFPGSHDTLCIGSTYVYTAPPGMDSYSWSVSSNGTIVGSSTSQTMSVTINSGSDFAASLTVTDANGCVSSCTNYRNVQVAPPVCEINGPTPVCVNSTGNVYTVNTGSFPIGSYSWSIDGNGMPSGPTNGNSVSVTAGVVGTYTVNVTLKASFNTCTTLCSKTVTVNTGASAGTITGNNSLCAGTTTDLNSTGPSGGTWSSSNTGVATVNASGLVSGLTAGMSTIAYTVTDGTGCSNSTSMVVTVIGPPDPGTLSPVSPTLCIGATLTMSSTVPGGTWRSNNPAIASIVSSSGLLTGLSAVPGSGDTSTIHYTVSNGCFERSVRTTALVLLLPNAGTISGTPSVCIGQTTALSSNGLGGGTWSSDDLSVATVHPSTGVVTGAATGTATITYTVTGGNGCTNSASVVVTVNSSTATTISGLSLVCGSSTGNVYSTAAGMSSYLWSVSGNGTMVGSNTGSSVSVTAAATGTFTVSVVATNSSGCSQTALKTVTISPLPAATITPSANPYCITSQYLILTTPTAATGTVNWSGSSGSGIFNISNLSTIAQPTATGLMTYNVTVTTVDGCSNSGSVQVNVIDKPACPSTFFPANAAAGVSGNVVLSWNTVTGATGYRISMGDNAPNYNNLANNIDLGNTTTYDPLGAGNLPPGATYGYVITPYNDCGSAVGCPLVTFNTCVESFVCPGPQNINLNGSCAITVPDLVNGLTSNCGTLTFTQNPTASTVLTSVHNGTTNVTINASNNTSCTVVLTAKDVTPPTVNCKPATVVLSAGGTGSVSMAAVFLNGADNCGTVNQQSVAPNMFSCIHLGTNLVVLTVNDGNGNLNTCSAVVTVTDNTAPTPTCPGPVTVNCAGNIPAVNLASVTVVENCGSVTKSHVGDSAPYDQTCANRFKITRTYRATDQSNNSNTCSQVITVADFTKPTFSSVPANVTVQCNAIPAVGTATATDNCGGTVSVSYNGQSILAGSCPDSYTITRQWIATDACGNTKTATQLITVRDTKAPTFTSSPANITVQCSSIPAPGSATATDNCDASVAITYNGFTRTNGACPDTYVLIRHWTAADNCGNTKKVTQKISVQDTQKPVFTSVPANSTIQCSDTPPSPGTALATDNCDLSVSVTYLGESTTGATCGGSYLLQRTWLAVDNCGNSTAATQTITVQDTQAPGFTSVPNAVTIECSDLTPPIGNATATDACGGYVQIVFQGQTMTPGSCPANRTITRSWRAVDECGNSTTASQTITIQDTQAPVFSNAPGNVTVPCGGTLPSLPAVLAIDNCDTYVPVTYLGETSTGPNCPYTVTRRWTVADDCGNAVTHTQVISVAASLQNNGTEEGLLAGTPADQAAQAGNPVLSRQSPNDLSISLVPNPAAHEVWVTVGATQDDQAILLLFDAGGRMKLRQVSGAAKGENRYRLDLAGLPSGLYTVQVVVGGQAHSKKLMILQD